MIAFEELPSGCHKVSVGNLTLYFDKDKYFSGYRSGSECGRSDNDVPEISEFPEVQEDIIKERLRDGGIEWD